MAFIVEDGTGLADANAMASVTEFKEYHTDRGNVDMIALSDTEVEFLLVRGADYLNLNYTWCNDKLVSTQSMPFPRTVFDFPVAIKRANIILASKAYEYSLIEDAERSVIKEKISSIEVVYDENDMRVGKTFTEVELLISPYLMETTSTSISHGVIRT